VHIIRWLTPSVNIIFRTAFSFKVWILCECKHTLWHIALFICHCTNIITDNKHLKHKHAVTHTSLTYIHTTVNANISYKHK
jgi:hypothetical protein